MSSKARKKMFDREAPSQEDLGCQAHITLARAMPLWAFLSDPPGVPGGKGALLDLSLAHQSHPEC